MTNLVKYKPAQVAAFLDGLAVDRRDDVKLRLKGGVISAVIKRADGRVQTATKMLDVPFERRTDCDSSGMSPAQRRKVVRRLAKEGHRQTAIADLVGVSQATVSLDLKKR